MKTTANTTTLATNIYNAALDMDFGDYVETREEDINRLSAALKGLDPDDVNDSALIQALERIFA